MKAIHVTLAACLVAALPNFVFAEHIKATLSGYQEVPSVSTPASGTFDAKIANDDESISYELTFHDLEGDVRQAHIHIGYPQNSGGIVLWLCDSAANPSPSATTPECTENSNTGDLRNGHVTGTLTAADVQAQTANGIAGPAEWSEVLDLIRAGRTYANVHSVKFTGGEIRSQLDNGDDDSDDHGNHH